MLPVAGPFAMGVAGRTGQEAGFGFQEMEGSPLGPRAQEKQKLLGQDYMQVAETWVAVGCSQNLVSP